MSHSKVKSETDFLATFGNLKSNDWARELAPENELEIVITLAASAATDRVDGVENAIRRYFVARASIKQLEFTQLKKRGRLNLCVGLLFLFSCLLLGKSLSGAGDGSLAGIIKEGLTIAGWVAMWRPLEIYLYDWWPIYEVRHRLVRLARIRVS